MRTTTIAAAILLAAALPLTACSSSGSGSSNDGAKPAASTTTGKSKSASKAVDCSDQSLSQADWVANCQSATAEPSTNIAFGKTYTWPDGLKVSVTEARVFTDFTADEGAADPKSYEFRLKLKFTNGGKAAADLSGISTIIEGATNGGQAASSAFQNGAAPLEGRLAPGVTATKTDDDVLEKQYGRKIVVTVQRGDSSLDMAFPEFTGSIVG